MNTRTLAGIAIAAMMGTLTLGAGTAAAEDLNLNEKPDTVTMSLSPYSLGVGGGVISSLNDELSARSAAFMKLSVIQTINFADHFNMGLDLDWMLPGQNWAAELSLDYLLATGAIKPFLGVGGGFRYWDKYGSDFGNDIGASGTVHAGMLLDVMDELQLRVRVPFHVVANTAGDRGVGIDIGLLFSSPLRTTKVKKLKY